MPKIVACPKCQKKYKLPDSFKANRVRCKACGADFEADYDISQLNETMGGQDPRSRPKKQSPQKPPRQAPKPAQGGSKDSLSKMGLSQIKRQPDLFSEDQTGGPDPLRNHVVQDPGFGNANAGGRAKQNQSQPNAPSGALEDVVSNPFMADTGSGSVDARRKKALKRKKEDKLLAGYKTSSTSLNNDQRPSALSENGIKRTGFWLAHFFFNMALSVIQTVSGVASELQLGENAEPLSRESSMALNTMLLVAMAAGFAVFGFFYATTTNLRVQNIRFKNPLWKKIATGMAAAPWALWAVATLVAVVMALLKIVALLYVAAVLALVGLLLMIPSVAVQCLALALPPDYGIHKKLDVPAYIWLGLSALPLLFVIFISGYIALAATGVFSG